MDFDAMIAEILTYGDFRELDEDEYAHLKYPKFLPMMKMDSKKYDLPGFGQVFAMKTSGPMGMELLTMSFCPGEGAEMPYMLIDCMKVMKKRTVFVEYYDCTADKPELQELADVAERYASLPAYDEKEHWYVKERAPYSLIKGGTEENDEALSAMVLESAGTYLELCSRAKRSERNLPGLRAFRDRMINEGNPSSDVLNKALGKKGAEDFFRRCVMKIAGD